MKKRSKRTFTITLLFSLLTFLTLTLTMLLTILLAVALYRLHLVSGIFQESRTFFPALALASIVIGCLISHVIGVRPLTMLQDLSHATQEVARGNFDVRLNENTHAAEIRNMAHNFNSMAKELAHTELLRNDFIENVSHEFKTPLAAIEGYATLLQNPLLTEEDRQLYTRQILTNTRRLSSLSGNILLLSRLENQEMEIKQECFSLDEQLRECILLYEPQWTAANLDLDIDLDTADYTGNSRLLAQVWQNLLGNAMKFTPPQGKIQILLRKKEDCLQVSITDNGPGMTPEVQARIWEKFYQGDPSRAASGNGLGLTLVRRIIDLHGGSIEVKSAPGEGSTFIVTLPS